MLGRLFIADLKMFYRNRQAAFWAMAFPLIFVAVFGLFEFDQLPRVEMVVVDHADDTISRGIVDALQSVDFIETESGEDADAAVARVAEGEVGYALIIPQGLLESVAANQSVTNLRLIYDEGEVTTASIVSSVIGDVLDRTSMVVQGAQPLLALNTEGVAARQVNYFDFAMPGFVAMGVMFYGIIGIASVMALYRQQRVLRRIKATPLPARTFFLAQVGAYLVISLVQAVAILAVGILIFGANVYGNLLWVGPLIILANLTFLNMGFIVGAFSKTVEAASGMGNAVAMPMMFFSGVFFPTDSLPAIMRSVVQYLPLTPLVDALRGVMLDAKPAWEFPNELALLAGWVVVTSVFAVRTFKFE